MTKYFECRDIGGGCIEFSPPRIRKAMITPNITVDDLKGWQPQSMEDFYQMAILLRNNISNWELADKIADAILVELSKYQKARMVKTMKEIYDMVISLKKEYAEDQRNKKAKDTVINLHKMSFKELAAKAAELEE